VTENHELRGVYFRSTASADDGFSFSGAAVLTIGRGGITNYDQARQYLHADLRLGDHQYWDMGPGGLSVGNIDTNGKLLEIAGRGGTVIHGEISGAGGIALSGSYLELAGHNSYTGTTFVHTGVLNVSGDISSSASLVLGPTARITGSGQKGLISGSGAIEPGNSPGIMTAVAIDPSQGMSFHFEFTQSGSPDYLDAGNSGNDVLRLTGATPLTQPLTAANVINLYFDVTAIGPDDIFRGGFYLDQETDFLAMIQDATFQVFVASEGGLITYGGVQYDPWLEMQALQLSTVYEAADFGSGIVHGGVMQVQ